MVVAALRNAGGRLKRHLPGRAAVLAYHRVAEPVCDPWDLAVSPAHFDAQLAALGRIGSVVPLTEIVALPPLRRIGRLAPTFAITFDDGYVDNLDAALPTLERHRAPATVFVAPGLLDQPAFWWDVLAMWALASGLTPDRLLAAAVESGVLDAEPASRLGTSELDAATVHEMVWSVLVRMRHEDTGPTLERLAAASGVDTPVPDGRPMTTAELLELDAHPLVTIGAHTVTHPRLTQLDPDDARAEIVDAEQCLADLLGPSARVFAYPYGDTSPAVASLTASTGVAHAVTIEGRWIGHRGDPLLVPRLQPQDVDGPTFEEWIRHWA